MMHNPGRDIMKLFQIQLKQNSSKLIAEDVAIALWSYAVLSISVLDLCGSLADDFLQALQALCKRARQIQGEFDGINLSMIFQYQQMAFLRSDWPTVPQTLYQRASEFWKIDRERILEQERSSSLEGEVENVLRQICGEKQIKYEYFTTDGLFNCDFMVNYCGIEIAIEADGPFHYFRGSKWRTGNTLLRNEFSKNVFANFVVIEYHQWGYSERQREDFVTDLLNKEVCKFYNINAFDHSGCFNFDSHKKGQHEDEEKSENELMAGWTVGSSIRAKKNTYIN